MTKLRTILAGTTMILAGCAGDDGGGGDATGTGTAGTTGATAATGASSSSAAGSGSSASGGDTTGSGTTGTGTATDTAGDTGGLDPVCERWNADRANLSEGTWTGDLATCDPGDLIDGGRERAVALVNLYRFIAGLPEVTDDPVRNQKAQACALMMHANGMLSHDPPMSWTCYSADGAEAAGKSNISTGPAVLSVDLFMVDPGAGNAATLGHRRWILSNSLGPIGIGGTSVASCMWVIGGSGDAAKEFVAWPPPGTFPLQAVAPIWTGIDETGWSIQSDSIDLSGAQVTVTRDGTELPVTVTQLLPGYGSQYAISMIPEGWTTEVGTYRVEVSGVPTPISYDVTVVDCGG